MKARRPAGWPERVVMPIAIARENIHFYPWKSGLAVATPAEVAAVVPAMHNQSQAIGGEIEHAPQPRPRSISNPMTQQQELSYKCHIHEQRYITYYMKLILGPFMFPIAIGDASSISALSASAPPPPDNLGKGFDNSSLQNVNWIAGAINYLKELWDSLLLSARSYLGIVTASELNNFDETKCLLLKASVLNRLPGEEISKLKASILVNLIPEEQFKLEGTVVQGQDPRNWEALSASFWNNLSPAVQRDIPAHYMLALPIEEQAKLLPSLKERATSSQWVVRTGKLNYLGSLGLDLDNLWDEALRYLEVQGINRLAHDRRDQLNVSVLNSLTDDQLRQLNMSVLNGLTNDQLRQLNASVLNDLTDYQLRQLDASVLIKLTDRDSHPAQGLTANDLNRASDDFIRSLQDFDALNLLPDEEVGRLDARVLNNLSPGVLACLHINILNLLSDNALRGIRARVLNAWSLDPSTTIRNDRKQHLSARARAWMPGDNLSDVRTPAIQDKIRSRQRLYWVD